MASLVAVTGATGHVGGRVARLLAEAGTPQRLLVRDPSRAPSLAGAEVVTAEYGDAQAARSALEGVRTLFMVSAHEGPDRMRQHRTLVDAATAAGVEQVVYTSIVSAAPDATFTLARDHFHTEEHLRASGMGWTFLRDGFYLDVLPFFADDAGVIRGPAGEGRVAAVARADVARSAASVLAEPERHRGATYALTGPEALSLDDVARIATQVLGSQYTFENESVEEAYASRAHFGAEPWQLDAWVTTYTAFAAGDFAALSDDVQMLTGRAPISLAELLARRRARSGSAGRLSE